MVKDFSCESAFRYLKTGLVYEKAGSTKGEGVGRYKGRASADKRSGACRIQGGERRRRYVRGFGKQMLRADLTVPGNMQSR